jgi:predicted RNA-binding Zn-ribbon protein involved in translation (DUF1610 family)
MGKGISAPVYLATITCKSCGQNLEPEDKRCPACGSADREILNSDEGRGMEMIGLKEKAQGEPDYWRYTKLGEKISKGTKRPAREHLVIDRMSRHKYHHVEEQDESGKWVTVHHQEMPLDTRRERATKGEQCRVED